MRLGTSDRAAEAAAAAAIAKPQNPFVDDLLDALAGRDRISQMMLPESLPQDILLILVWALRRGSKRCSSS